MSWKQKFDAFYHVFCPFSWDYDSFVQRLTANYRDEDGSNDKLKEVNVYTISVDFVESWFMDGKVMKFVKFMKLIVVHC